MCPAERERYQSGCRASRLSLELPVYVVLVPPLLVPPLLVPPLLVPPLLVPPLLVPPPLVPSPLVPSPLVPSLVSSGAGCNVNRIAIYIFWIAFGSFVFAPCGGYEKALDYRPTDDGLTYDGKHVPSRALCPCRGTALKHPE